MRPKMITRTIKLERVMPATTIKPKKDRSQTARRIEATTRKGRGRMPINQTMTRKMRTS